MSPKQMVNLMRNYANVKQFTASNRKAGISNRLPNTDACKVNKISYNMLLWQPCAPILNYSMKMKIPIQH